MLLKFKVKNYKSIVEEAVLDMVAGSGSDNRHFLFIETNKVNILPIAGIYGVSASGKTNFIEAICNMCLDIRDSYKNGVKGAMRVVPNLVNTELSEAPTEYEICIGIKNKEYRYGYKAEKDGIIEEWLFERKLSRNDTKWQTVFERGENGISFSDKYRSFEIFRDFIGNNVLILSFLGKEKKNTSNLFMDIYQWILSMVYMGVMGGESTDLQFYFDTCVPLYTVDEALRENFAEFIREFDPSVIEIKVGKENIIIRRESGDYPLEIESLGIKKLFICYAVIHGHQEHKCGLFLVDELDSHLHPLVLRHIATMYHDENKNLRHSQLIYSSHNLIIMDNDYLRRDEIWLTKKNDKDHTNLYRLVDQEVRADMNYNKNYLGEHIELKYSYPKKGE